jgi:hypothetical protein
MSEQDSYVSSSGDVVFFDWPPLEGCQARVFRVASHDVRTGMTTFHYLPRALLEQEMADLEARTPTAGPHVVLDRPPIEDARPGVFRVFLMALRDPRTGMTTFHNLPRALSPMETTELGARRVIRPDELRPHWRALARELKQHGAGTRPKILQCFRLPGPGRWSIAPADDQAALALAQRAADQAGEGMVVGRTGSGELLIGSGPAFEDLGGRLGTRAVLVARPGLLGDSEGTTLRQARTLLGSMRTHKAVAAAVASVPGLPRPASRTAAAVALQAVAALLPAETHAEMVPPVSGWQYRAELTPVKAELSMPAELHSDWHKAARWLEQHAAGTRPKILQYHRHPRISYRQMSVADDQAALALAQRAADKTGEAMLIERTGSGELLIGSGPAMEDVGDGLGTTALLVAPPGRLGDTEGTTLRQVRALLSSARAHNTVTAELASVPAMRGPASGPAAAAALQAIAALLQPSNNIEFVPSVPGWQYRAELMPIKADLLIDVPPHPDPSS